MKKKRTEPLPRVVKAFARNFKAAREEAGLTQYDVSKKTGIAQPDISSIEKGQQNVTLARMNKLAKAVKKSVSELTQL